MALLRKKWEGKSVYTTGAGQASAFKQGEWAVINVPDGDLRIRYLKILHKFQPFTPKPTPSVQQKKVAPKKAAPKKKAPAPKKSVKKATKKPSSTAKK